MARGRLRIYLGAAPGVGKTYAMLNEGWRRHTRGTDVVVGFLETHGRKLTAAQLRDLEVVARRRLTHHEALFEEMDVAAILARAPQVALVDELAHSNVQGARNANRWQDVEELLEAGIDVVSTLNIQHLESLNDVVERITGVKQHETIPDAVVRAAEQVELVDMTPEAVRRRMAHGNIYAPEKVDASLANYFRPGNLGALRELALLWVADRVDAALHDYMAAHGIAEPWETRERVMVALTGGPGREDLIRRAARMATRTKSELLGVHVRPHGLAATEPAFLDRHRTLLEQLGGEFREVVGDDVARALFAVARAEHVTQLVLGTSRRSRWTEFLRGSVVNSVIRGSGSIDVHVISTPTDDAPKPSLPRRRLAAVSPRRRTAGFLLAAVGPPLLNVVLIGLPDEIALSSVLLLYLSLTVGIAAVGGLLPGLISAVGASLLGNYYFTPPLHTWTIDAPENVLALIVLVVVAAVVSTLVDLAARRDAEATRASTESAALARLAGTLLDSPDPLPRLVQDLRTTFQLDAAAILRHHDDGTWSVEAAAGTPVPAAPTDGSDALELSADTTLVVDGPRTPADDRRVLAAFAAQLAVAVSNRSLQAEAASASHLAEGNRLRTALLAAVSHDLRTPLASIKASATSLPQTDVDWTPDATREFVEAIVVDADRLNTLVGNLLDMSRLQTDTIAPTSRPVGLEEVRPGGADWPEPSRPPGRRGRARVAATSHGRPGAARTRRRQSR